MDAKQRIIELVQRCEDEKKLKVLYQITAGLLLGSTKEKS